MSGRPTLLLLGEPRLLTPQESDEPVAEPLTGNTSTTLLALLALEPGRVVTLDRLLDQVWPEAALESGRGRVHVQVSRLRHRLAASGLRIDSRHGGYVLAGAPDTVDVHRFSALAGSAREAAADGDWGAVLSSSQVAGELWRGEPFSGMRAPALDLERSHLVERRRSLLQLQCQAFLWADAPDEALLIAAELRQADPYGEFGVWASMTASARLGRRADALEVFDGYRRMIAEELGLNPSPQLQELQHAVLRDDSDMTSPASGSTLAKWQRRGAGTARTHPSSSDSPPSLVGRDRELACIDSMVRDVRKGRPSVLLMEGEAGIGRSTLARYAALEGERQGVRVVRARGLDFVPTATLSVWRHVGSRLGLDKDHLSHFDSAPTSVTMAGLVDGVLAAVRDQPTLLVFDDLHRVDDASAQALQWLVGEIWDEPLAVVATRQFHGVPSTAAKEIAWTALSQEDLATVLELRPLGLTDVVALASVPEKTAQPLLRRTGGNPRLLRELLAPAPHDETGVPCGVISLVRSQLVAVPPLTWSVVTAAAVAGRQFDTHELGKALGLEPDAVVETLRPAVELGLITPPRRDTKWSFRHEVEREGVLDLIADARLQDAADGRSEDADERDAAP